MRAVLLVALVFVSTIIASASAREQLSCSCAGSACSCCQNVAFTVPNTKDSFNGTICTDLRWDLPSLSAAVDLSVNGKVVVSRNFSAGYDFCYPVVATASVCVGINHFYINTQKKTLSACIDLSVKALYDWITIWSTQLGCFALGSPFGARHIAQHAYNEGPLQTSSQCDASHGACCVYSDRRGQHIHAPRMALTKEVSTACPSFLESAAEKLSLCRSSCMTSLDPAFSRGCLAVKC